MISIVNLAADFENAVPGILPMARLYYGGQKAANDSMQAYQEWAIDQINFNPTKYWTDPSTGIKYPIEFDLKLKSPDGSYLTVNVTAIRNDQVIENNVNKYEGVYTVQAKGKIKDLNLQGIKGFAWAEIH